MVGFATIDNIRAGVTMTGMGERAETKPVQVVGRLVPVVWADEHLLAVNKPPEVDLTAPIRKRGPSVIETVMGLVRRAAPFACDGAPIPLILPEKYASGVALFAADEVTAGRFAAGAQTRPLQYEHTLVLTGRASRQRIAIKPEASGRQRVAPPAARLDILESNEDCHIVRCATSAPTIDEVRRAVKAAGMRIVGDARPGHIAEDARNPKRQPLLHLERLSFPHPQGGQPVSIHAHAPRAFRSYLATRRLTERHLRTALIARLACILDETTDCFRLIGPTEGISGLIVEKYGSAIVLEALRGKFNGDEQALRHIGNWYAKLLGVECVYAKNIPRTRSEPDVVRTHGAELVTLLRGEAQEEVTVTENGIRFVIHPADGLATGLYLDHRDNRRRICQMAEGKDVLNLFAYTCGFSVAAAVGGAASTTSVDLTVRSLEWGKANFAANGLELEAHTFIRSDAFDYFKRAERQKKRFDLIILDPPSFARSKKPKRTFEVRKHLVELIEGARELLRPGGQMLIATNNRQLSANWLLDQVDLASGGRYHKVVARPRLPIDYAADPAHQKSVLVRFD